jgi:hypothetical protein
LLTVHARAALWAIDLSAELGRRAKRLLAIAPKLRARGADDVVARLLSNDAIVASERIAGMSDWGLRRLFDRLVDLGAVRASDPRDPAAAEPASAGRDRSRSSPSTPAYMNRSCQRQTRVLDLPVSARTAAPQSPLRRTIRTRQTCFCALPGEMTIACKR